MDNSVKSVNSVAVKRGICQWNFMNSWQSSGRKKRIRLSPIPTVTVTKHLRGRSVTPSLGGTIPDLEDPRLSSNGKPTGATTVDPLHIQVYAWCLANLGFGPDLAGRPTDLSRAGKECRLSLPEVREAFGKLLKEGDLKVERTRRGDIWYLAPVRW